MVHIDGIGLLVTIAVITALAWPDTRTSRRVKAKRLVGKAEDLIGPAAFSDTSLRIDLANYFEGRLAGDRAQRAQIISFYKDESRLLYAVMIVAYESLLFSDFSGTERHCSYRTKEQLKQVFISAASGLVERGYDPAEYTNKAEANIQAVEQFCADRGMSFRLFD